MTWAMIGAAAVSAIASDVSNPGSVQGGAPPATNLGGGSAAGLLGSGLAGSNMGAGSDTPVTDAAKSAQRGPDPGTVPDWFRRGSTPDESSKPNPFGNFLGGLDKGLQSPWQTSALGLLGKHGGDYGALGGLLAMGLLNKPGQ